MSELRTPTSGGRTVDQRYYAVGMGRFNSPDPSGTQAANPKSPRSWNMYSYVKGDPINHNDPTGRGIFGDIWNGIKDFFDEAAIAESGDEDEGGGGGGWDPCSGNSFAPTPDPACYAPAPEPISTPTAPAKPECFAQLKDRPVNDPTAAKFKAVHTFWWVQDDTGTEYVISGGPSPGPSGTQYLNVSVTPGADNGSGDNSSAHTAWSSGLSWLDCDQVDAIVAGAKGFRNNTIQYHAAGVLGIGGPNSNSAAHYFGVISGFNPNPPTAAYGWWSPIVFP